MVFTNNLVLFTDSAVGLQHLIDNTTAFHISQYPQVTLGRSLRCERYLQHQRPAGASAWPTKILDLSRD